MYKSVREDAKSLLKILWTQKMTRNIPLASKIWPIWVLGLLDFKLCFRLDFRLLRNLPYLKIQCSTTENQVWCCWCLPSIQIVSIVSPWLSGSSQEWEFFILRKNEMRKVHYRVQKVTWITVILGGNSKTVILVLGEIMIIEINKCSVVNLKFTTSSRFF